ncbi:MAG: bifunctional DNA-formamidopyrimidine glycosylase/DNA-(apurinic or apyrimidinic site) lyase [Polyangiales bacterium]
MPELPEVEIARRNLQRWLRGQTLVAAHVAPTRVVRSDHARGRGSAVAATSLERALVGRRVRSADRRGKWLRIALDDGALVFSHLGMSGRWVRRPREAEAERSERARLDLERTSVRYVDPRMFGRLLLAKDDIAEWRALGPDPLVDGVDPGKLGAALAALRRTVKEALMDQSVLAGIGNIQATEALYFARLDPRARTDALTPKDVRALARGIDETLARTLAHEQGPEITYVEDAGAPNPFVIYGRGGEPCPRCETPLTRIVLGGRTTVFCARCQPARAKQRR